MFETFIKDLAAHLDAPPIALLAAPIVVALLFHVAQSGRQETKHDALGRSPEWRKAARSGGLPPAPDEGASPLATFVAAGSIFGLAVIVGLNPGIIDKAGAVLRSAF